MGLLTATDKNATPEQLASRYLTKYFGGQDIKYPINPCYNKFTPTSWHPVTGEGHLVAQAVRMERQWPDVDP